MINDILISIIIPVYNAEKHIGRCIESVMNQTHQCLEIILVDDGSTDSSLEICEKYAKKDERIRVLHKENGGPSSARNYGLKKCCGEYIGFIDADDYIEKEMYEELLCAAVKHNTVISMCGYYRISGEEKNFSGIYEEIEVISNKQLMKDIYTFKYMGVLWNKLFKKSLFFCENEMILFDESIHFCEDVLMLTVLTKNSSDIAYCNKGLYNYVISLESLCHDKISEKKLTMFHAMDCIAEQCCESFPSLVKYANYFALSYKIEMLLQLEDSDMVTNKKEWIATVKKELRSHSKDSDFNMKLKLFIACNFSFVYKWKKKLKTVNFWG